MPIKPENRALYPKDWPEISLQAKQRAAFQCQHAGCGARQYDVGWWREIGGQHVWHENARGLESYSKARTWAAWIFHGQGEEGPKPIVIVLTVAHLNHDPTDCRPENLRAMCQRHHLAHDHDHHRANAQATRRAKSGTLEMF